MYLMIRNAGVADSAAFTILGVSTTRNAGVAGTIGQFGSGSKHAISLMLRHKINPIIISGNLTMEFFTRVKLVQGRKFDQVYVKYSGKDIFGNTKSSTEDLGFVLQWGEDDWNNPVMAFREFVANAIDGATIMGQSFKDVEISIKDNPRAKKDHTAIFLPLTPEVEEIYQQLGTMFLHYSNPSYLSRKILPKIRTDGHILFYKKGVLARTIKGESAFDYNLGDELTLDESRNAQTWDVSYAAALALRNAEPRDIAHILSLQIDGKDIWENNLDASYLNLTKEENKKNFQAAFKAVAGDKAVAVNGVKNVADFVERKGFNPVKIKSNWFQVLEQAGVATENQVLEGLEKDGLQESEALPTMMKVVDEVWELVELNEMTNGRTKPPVKAFSPIMSATSQTWGEYRNGTVYLHTDMGDSPLLFKVALEEVAHHITGASDMSRDLQDFLFRMITKMWGKVAA